MRKQLVVLMIVAIGVLAAPSTVLADNNAALVIVEDNFAGLFDGNGNLIFLTNPDRTVSTQSQNDTMILTVHYTGLDNDDRVARKYDSENNPLFPGLECGAVDPLRGLRLTTDWQETVSASGNAVLRCIFTND